jgi:CHAT domain-containing protein/Flp pilus assembly protein TadD
VAFVTACRTPDPRTRFNHAYQTFLHGDLLESQREAESGYRRYLKSKPRWAMKFRILEAEIFLWRGMNQQVLALLEAPADEGDRGAIISTLTLQGLANARLHNFKEAEDELDKAGEMCTASVEPACGAVLRARGLLAFEQDQFPRAQDYLERTLSFAREHRDQFLESTALLNLGAVALHESHYDEAIDRSQSAAYLATNLQARDINQVALGNLGWAQYKLGDFEKALEAFNRAIAASRELGDDLNELRWIATSGYPYLDLGDRVNAERAYSRALNLAMKINSKEDIHNALVALALVSEQTSKLDEADQYAERAIAMARTDGNRLDELYPLLVEGRVAATRNDSTRAENIFREVSDDPKSDVSLKWEAQHALAKLYEDENRTTDADREYRAALKMFETARSELKHEESELPFLTNASRIYDDYVRFLVEHGRSDEALQVADFTRARTLAEGLGLLKKRAPLVPSSLNAQAVAKRTGSTVLFYWLGEQKSYVWAITGAKTNIFTLPAQRDIKAAVERYEKTLLGPQDVLQTVNRDGTWLYQNLVAPASSSLRKSSKVLIVPDGSLNGLNFETLIVPGASPHYWIEDVTVSDASSLRLLHSPVPAMNSGKLLMIGDPLTASRDYGPLPNAGVEMEKVERHFPARDRTRFAQQGATAAAYLASRPEQFRYIHFVAHGTASRTSPLDSAVVLSPSGKQEDSFKLYARDVIGCPLRARLVTISTCYGAGTRAYTGEGLVGLSWAFLRAGARNVVGALWEVNDTSTPQLMDRFYAELKNGRTPDAALREAKLDFLHSSSAFRKPYYWAPFQLYTAQ